MESSSSPFFSHLHHRPHTTSTSSFSHKRPFSLNPSSTNEPQSTAKKAHHTNTPFSTITHSPPPQEFKCPMNPLLTYAPAKSRARPPKTGVVDSMRSPTQRASNSFPIPEWLKKMRDCIREVTWLGDQILSYIEHGANAQTYINTDSPHADNCCVSHKKNNYPTMENGLPETVTIENEGEALIINVKCPCGAGYQILLLGGVSYYRLM